MTDAKKVRKDAEDAFRVGLREQYPELTLYQLMQFESAAFRVAQRVAQRRFNQRQLARAEERN